MGGFWGLKFSECGWVFGRVAYRTGFISIFAVFFGNCYSQHHSKISNICCFLIINHKCLMNFILDYHEHGYSKKSSHKSGWVSDFWAKHSRQCIHIKYPRAKTLQETAKKHFGGGIQNLFPPENLSSGKNLPRLCIIDLKNTLPLSRKLLF